MPSSSSTTSASSSSSSSTMDRAIMASKMSSFAVKAIVTSFRALQKGTIFDPPDFESEDVCACCGRVICLMNLFGGEPKGAEAAGAADGNGSSGGGDEAEIAPLTDASKSMLRAGLAWLSALMCITFLNHSVGLCLFWVWFGIMVPLIALHEGSPLQRKELFMEAVIWTFAVKLLHPTMHAGMAASITGNLLWWARISTIRVGDLQKAVKAESKFRLSWRIEFTCTFVLGTLAMLWTAVVWTTPWADEVPFIVPIMSWVCTFGGTLLMLTYCEVFDVPYSKWVRVAVLAYPSSLVLSSRWASPMCLGVPHLTTPLRLTALACAVALVLLQRWLDAPILGIAGTYFMAREGIRIAFHPFLAFASSSAKWQELRFNAVPALVRLCQDQPGRAVWVCAVASATLWAVFSSHAAAVSWLVRTLNAGVGGLVVNAIIVDYVTVRRYRQMRRALAAEETPQQTAQREEKWRAKHSAAAAAKGRPATPPPQAGEGGDSLAAAAPVPNLDTDALEAEDSGDDDRGWPVSGRRTKRTAAWIASLVCFAVESCLAAVTGSFRRSDGAVSRVVGVLGLAWILVQAVKVLSSGRHRVRPSRSAESAEGGGGGGSQPRTGRGGAPPIGPRRRRG